MTHSRLAPSSAYRWLTCPASLQYAKDDTSSEYATEGSQAHSVLEHVLRTGRKPLPRRCTQCKAIGTKTVCSQCGGKAGLDREVQRAIQLAVDVIRALEASINPEKTGIETRIESHRIEGFGGTVDWYAISGDHCEIVDYKHGVRYVEAIDNAQLKCYALLLQEQYGRLKSFAATIVQPRSVGTSSRVRRSVFGAEELAELRLSIANAIVSENLYWSGEHCVYCPAMQKCPHLAAQASKVAKGQIHTLASHELVHLLQSRAQIKKWLDMVPRELKERLEQGETITGIKVVEAKGNRAWKDEEEALKHLKRQRVPCTIEKLKSPATLEKEGYGQIIEPLVTRPSLGLVVVPESDRRRAVEVETGSGEFQFDKSDLSPSKAL